MSDTVLAILRDPAIALGATIASTIAAAGATAALAFFLLSARRRLEAIEGAQAEMAAFMANEVRRLGKLIVQERASQLGSAVRQARLAPAATRPTVHTLSASTPKSDGATLHQPLRKTVH